MAKQLGVIQEFMQSLDRSTKSGAISLTNAIKRSSPFKSSEEVRNALITDCGTTATDVDDFLKTFCGINFKTKDTGAITGSEADGSTKTIASVIPESGKLDTTFEDNNFIANELNVELVGTFSGLTQAEKYIWQGLYTWWISNSLDLIADSFGSNFSFTKKSSAVTNQLYVEFVDNTEDKEVAISAINDDSSGDLNGFKLTINMNTLKDSLSKDELTTSDLTYLNTYFDRAVAHELAYAVMQANINTPIFDYLSGFIIEGLAELATGAKDSLESRITSIAEDITNLELAIDEKNLGRYEDLMYEGGYLFFRYLARQAGDLTIANKTADTIVRTFYGNDTINNYANNVTILSNSSDSYGSSDDEIYIRENVSGNYVISGQGKDTIFIYANTENTTINSGKGTDSIVSRGENALIYGEEGNDIISLSSSAENNTIFGGKGGDCIVSGAKAALIYGEDSNDEIYLLKAARNNTIFGGAGADYVELFKGTANHTISTGAGKDTIIIDGAENISLASEDDIDYIQIRTGSKVTVSSGAGNDSIYSGAEVASISADDGNDYIHIYSQAKSNTVSGGKGNDTIKNYCENGVLYRYASGDGNDFISGFTTKDTLRISGSTYSSAKSGNDVVLTVNKDTITLEGAAALSKINIANVISTVTASTIKTVNDSTKSPVTVGSAIKTIDASKRTKAVNITGNANANTINSGSGNDTISGGKGNDSIRGNAGNDKLYGNAGNDKLYGGAGNDSLFGNLGDDTLSGGAGDDTLTGGDGKDVFIYASGKDVITDYATGDKISIGTDIYYTDVSGSDVILNFGSSSNTLTIKNAKGNSLSMINSAGKSFSTVVSSSSTLNITDKSKSSVAASSVIRTINASKRTTAINITGNKLDNTIKGGTNKDTIQGGAGDDSIAGNAGNDSLLGNAGNDKLYGNAGNDKLYGGSGNDSLWGGAGDDSLWGGKGTDVFTYIANNGTDHVMDYESGELFRIFNATGTAKASFSKSSFSDSTLTLSIKGGGAVIFNNVDTSTKFNINGTSYKVSGSKLAKS